MSNKKQQQNDEILAIRMPKKLLDQLNALAVAKGVGTSTMARMALIDYLRDEAPNALIGATPSTSTTGTLSPQQRMQSLSPSMRQQYEEDWGE
jgi:metal-responsive CopG/Arc/MetJ family transcriptional regulator